MGYRYRDSDRYYGRGPPSRNENDYYQDRRGPHPSFGREHRRPDDRRFMNEIATRALFLGAKKFYLDVVEGSSGKMLKLSEVAQTGQKSKMLMDLETAMDFHDKISDFCDFICSYDGERSDHHNGPLKSDSMVKDEKRYYIDLLENHRGMFLKVALRCPSLDRVQLVFPAQGLPEIRDALTELLSEHGSNKKRKVSEIPEDQSITIDDDYRCDMIVICDDEVSTSEDVKKEKEGHGERVRERSDGNKLNCKDRMFQFEVKTNDAGTYLSITESSSKFRSVINVPQKCWQEFVSSIEEKLNELKGVQSEGLHDSEGFEIIRDATP